MRITCVHQGYELYGSDRSFVETVRAIRAAFPAATIDVVLPKAGPIVAPLEAMASTITIEPLWVLRRKDLKRLATIGLFRLPGAVLRALARLRRSDLVYVNTSVVADYMIASRFVPGRTILHVHEIPQGATRRVLRGLVGWSRADIIFNSKATRAAFALPDSLSTRVIYNGLSGPDQGEPRTYDGSRPLRILMLGRFSRIKGQEVLIEAMAGLPRHLTPEVRIAGGAFEDETRERNLAGLIRAAGLDTHVRLLPFMPDPAPLYRWADIVAVPSRLPESLGRVAIEAMAHGRPPVASAIGGLMEVVDDGRTGWLVPPDAPQALADTLRRIIEDPAAWGGFPAAARLRYEALFSEPAAAEAIKAALTDTLDRRGAKPASGPRAAGLPERAA